MPHRRLPAFPMLDMHSRMQPTHIPPTEGSRFSAWRYLHATPSARLGICRVVILLSSLFVLFPAWSACVPGSQSSQEPYLGYTTGDKGAPEEDETWHASVRTLTEDDGSPQFELITRPGQHFDSIEPIGLGDGAVGFVALRHGCLQLLDPEGTAYPTPAFETLEYDSAVTPGQVLLRLVTGSRYRLALFGQGRLLAASQQDYTAAPFSSRAFWPEHLREVYVETEHSSGHGIIDLRDLGEVLAPNWQHIAAIGLVEDSQPARYLLATHDARSTLFPLDGGTPLIRDIASLDKWENLFPHAPGRQATERAALVVRLEGEAGCRLLDMRLRPLMPHLLPLRQGHCDTGQNSTDRRYLFTDADNQTVQVYAIEPDARLRLVSSIPGRIEMGQEATGLVVVKTPSKQSEVYRVHRADGSLASPTNYSGFQTLGCGFMEVQHQGRWLSLMSDGRVLEERFYPFSC